MFGPEYNFNSESKKEKWAKLENHSFDPNSFYRIVNENGYKDFLENGILRSSPAGTESKMVGHFDIGHRPTPFPSFSKGEPDLTHLKKGEDNFIFETNTLLYRRGDKNPVTGNSVKGTHWAYRPIDEKTGEVIVEIKSEMIKNIYKIDKDGNIFRKR